MRGIGKNTVSDTGWDFGVSVKSTPRSRDGRPFESEVVVWGERGTVRSGGRFGRVYECSKEDRVRRVGPSGPSICHPGYGRAPRTDGRTLDGVRRSGRTLGSLSGTVVRRRVCLR